MFLWAILVALQSEAQIFRRPIAVIAGSDPAVRLGYSSLVFVVCCVASGLYEELISRSEDFYRVCECV
jgi:hypothetical protein